MAFDACMMRAVLHDIEVNFPDAKVEKVLQPQNDEIDLVVHSGKLSKRLIFNVGANAPRLSLSDEAKENPKVPPMICMLLRKRLVGARLVGIRQIGFDRIAEFTFAGYDEMGFLKNSKLICELMGKYANLIYTDDSDKIITAMKLIDFADSQVRQILPGLAYSVPKDAGKKPPVPRDDAFLRQAIAACPPERTVEKFITGTYAGVATQIAHELAYRVGGKVDLPMADASGERLFRVVTDWQDLLEGQDYTPTAVYDADGKPKDYSYMDISWQSEDKKRTFPSIPALFDSFFAEKDRMERIHQRGHDLLLLLNNAEARTEKKLALQREALADSERAESYRREGDLITANLYRVKRGDEVLRAVDYEDPDMKEIEVKLDARLSPAQNAQKRYKQYNKAKNAKKVLTACIEDWEKELVYLASVRDFLNRATCEEDIVNLREELYQSGYAARMKDFKPQKQNKSKPLSYTTSGGWQVLVGRNNLQNDQLTFKTATKGDLWFHVKDLPGSHVILFCGGEEPSEQDYTEAAALAAKHSKATGDLVAVDYTRVKNVKKPAGAKPGFVIYSTNYTAFVKPATDEKE